MTYRTVGTYRTGVAYLRHSSMGKLSQRAADIADASIGTTVADTETRWEAYEEPVQSESESDENDDDAS